MFVESVHGTLRQMFLAPAVGDFTARRIAFFTGMLLIFLIAYLMARWIAAPTTGTLFAVGVMWVGLTLAFEFGIGYFVLAVIFSYFKRNDAVILKVFGTVVSPVLKAVRFITPVIARRRVRRIAHRRETERGTEVLMGSFVGS